MTELPAGTVTFLFTDIQGSTPLWERDPHAMQAGLAKHNAILEKAIREHGGRVFKVIGDAFQAAFPVPDQAVRAAIATQRALQAGSWDETGPLRVRMGIHTARAEVHGEDYAVSHDLNRVARITAAGHGGQILISASVADLARQHLAEDISLQDMGEHQLKGLVRPERIYQVTAPDLPAEFPPLASQVAPRHNLPAPPTPLVGRQLEMTDLLALLRREDVRLVTLTGPGGTGKTRLALEAAHRSVSHYPDGVFFISLAPLQDAQLVPAAIAGELGVPESQGEPLLETLKGELAKRQILLLLDNFEHLIMAAPIVAELLAAAPGINILVTSRERLRLRGEHEFPLDPLPVPDLEKSATSELIQRSPAVTLFLQRAEAVLPSFHLTGENAAAVAEICVLLDGLPLAIELAAARVKLLPPQVMLERLKDSSSSNVGASLNLLSSGPRDLPARQQTMQHTMEWSYRLLSAEEQALCRRLAVFAGGFTLQAVEAVFYPSADLPDDLLEGLASLVEKSLIYRDWRSPDLSRFSMLFSLRKFALGRLDADGELAACRDAHAAHYLALAEQMEPDEPGRVYLGSDVSSKSIAQVEVEQENLRAALRWSLRSANAQLGLRLTIPLLIYWLGCGAYQEALHWSEAVASQTAGQVDPRRAKLLHRLAWTMSFINHRQNADRIARALEEALAIYHRMEEADGICAVLSSQAIMESIEGNIESAAARLKSSVEFARGIGNKTNQGHSLRNLAWIMLLQGDLDQAWQHAQESQQLYQEIGIQYYLAQNEGVIGWIALQQGRLEEALSHTQVSIQVLRSIEVLERDLIFILFNLAGIAARSGDGIRAAELCGAAHRVTDSLSLKPFPVDQPLFESIETEARQAASEEDWVAGFARGQAISQDIIVDWILEMIAALHAHLTQPSMAGSTAGQKISKPDYPAGLTAREVEVLRLVAQGLSDIQVAEELVISPRTVNAHLTSIYSKMGVNSRAAATRFAVEQGLV